MKLLAVPYLAGRGLLAFIFLCLFLGSTSSYSSPVEIVHDTDYYFQVQIPKQWTVRRSQNVSSFWRLSAGPSSGDLSVSFYSLWRRSKIDLEKFAKLDKQIFKDLGEIEEEKTIRRYLFFPKAIEMIHKKNIKGYYALTHYQSDGTYSYVVLVLSKSKDFSASKEIIDSLSVDVPDSANLKNGLSDEKGWLLDFVYGLLIIGILYLLGITGRTVRKGVEMKKALKTAIKEAYRKGATINTAVCNNYNNKATIYIWGPTTLWLILYISIFVLSPFKQFLQSLALLAVPALGYCGILFGPSHDGSDYLPGS